MAVRAGSPLNGSLLGLLNDRAVLEILKKQVSSSARNLGRMLQQRIETPREIERFSMDVQRGALEEALFILDFGRYDSEGSNKFSYHTTYQEWIGAVVARWSEADHDELGLTLHKRIAQGQIHDPYMGQRRVADSAADMARSYTHSPRDSRWFGSIEDGRSRSAKTVEAARVEEWNDEDLAALAGGSW